MTDERIFAYLLGELPGDESERFEDECFADDDLPEHVRLAEDELIDAYLRDRLTPEQRQHFEQNYLTTPARFKRVATAASLLRYVDTLENDEPPAQTSDRRTWISGLTAFWGGRKWALRAGLAVGVFAVVAGGLWLSRPRVAPHRGLPTLATLTLTINSDDRRDEGASQVRIKLAPGVEGVLRIYLKLPSQPAAASYRVELVREDGEVSTVGVVSPDADSLSVGIPATQLTRGQYVLRLFAIRPDGTQQRVIGVYLFNVE